MARADAASAIAGNTFSNVSNRLVFKHFQVLNIVGDCEIVLSRGCPYIRSLKCVMWCAAVLVDTFERLLRDDDLDVAEGVHKYYMAFVSQLALVDKV